MVGAGTWSPSASPAQHSAPGPGRMGGRAGPGHDRRAKAPSHGPVAGADGTYVVADAEQVTLRDARGTVRSRTGGSGFVIAPDGNQIAVYGRDALALVAPGQVTATALVTTFGNRPVYSAGFSPDGSAIAYVRAADQGVDVFVVTLADRKSRRSPIAPTATRSSSRETARPWCTTARTKAAGQASWSPGSVEPRR